MARSSTARQARRPGRLSGRNQVRGDGRSGVCPGLDACGAHRADAGSHPPQSRRPLGGRYGVPWPDPVYDRRPDCRSAGEIPFPPLAGRGSGERTGTRRATPALSGARQFSGLAPILDRARGIVTGPRGTMLAEFLELLSRNLATVDAASAPQLKDAIGAMIAACVSPSPDRLAAAARPLDLGRMERIRRVVRQHLRSPKMGPDALCRLVGMSRSALYRLMESQGGVTGYIRAPTHPGEPRGPERSGLRQADRGDRRGVLLQRFRGFQPSFSARIRVDPKRCAVGSEGRPRRACPSEEGRRRRGHDSRRLDTRPLRRLRSFCARTVSLASISLAPGSGQSLRRGDFADSAGFTTFKPPPKWHRASAGRESIRGIIAEYTTS